MTTTNTVPMHPNAARPAPLYLNPGMALAEQIDMLNRMIDAGGWHGKTEPYARCITVTPKLSEWVLSRPGMEGWPINRKRSPRKVKQYGRDIGDGNWALTGQPIIFSRTGRLLDGGNRLSAIIMAGKPIRTLAVFGVFDEAFVQLDNGRNRTKKDILDILGVEDSSIKSKAMRWVYLLTEGRCGPHLDVMPSGATDRNWKPDNAGALQMWRERFEGDAAFDWACLIAKGVAKRTGRVTDKSTLAALLYIYLASQTGRADILKRSKELADFAQSMAVIGKRASRPGSKLVKRLTEKLKAGDGRLHEHVRVVMTVRAIEAHLDHAAPSFANIDSETDLPKLPKVGTDPVKIKPVEA
jgi:hypothetical protein